jgi:hypothetical protein
MKQTDRLKKEKSPALKTAILNAKKPDPKKPTKKEEVPIPKSTHKLIQLSVLPPDTANWSQESPQERNHRSNSTRRLPR